MKKIYIKNYKRKRTHTIEDVIEYLLCKEPPSYIIDSKHQYRLQCGAHKSRSLYDIIKIVKTYFSNATDSTILKTIFNYIYNNNEPLNPNYDSMMVIIYCPDIKRWVVQTVWHVYCDKDELDQQLLWGVIYDYEERLCKMYDKKIKGVSLKDFLMLNGISEMDIDKRFS